MVKSQSWCERPRKSKGTKRRRKAGLGRAARIRGGKAEVGGWWVQGTLSEAMNREGTIVGTHTLLMDDHTLSWKKMYTPDPKHRHVQKKTGKLTGSKPLLTQ